MKGKIYHFEKKDKDWQNALFYKIDFDKDQKKCLYFILETPRIKNSCLLYDYWGFKFYGKNGLKIGEIESLLEWGDIEYGISKLSNANEITYFNDSNEGYIECEEPDGVYELVNSLIRKDGVEYNPIYSIDEYTPCGFYYM